MKKTYGHLYTAIVGIGTIIAMMVALLFCFYMVNNINRQMNESATSNLLNTTRVITENLENCIDTDLKSLNIVGEIYKNADFMDQAEADALCQTMGFESIKIVDEKGKGVDFCLNQFEAGDLPCYDQWQVEQKGHSNAYYGEAGRTQITLWAPIYSNEAYIGTVFGDVLLSKYYSANLFTFYEGAGRTYLFNGADGSWILRSLGTDGVSRQQGNMYSLLLHSGNSPEDVGTFQSEAAKKSTGTAVFHFNGEYSYIGFMPLPCFPDWCVATVIARDVLLKEAAQVQWMIRAILLVFCITLITATFVVVKWQIKKTKRREIDYREALFANVSANIDSAFIIYEIHSKKTVFVSDNVQRLLGLERNWLQEDAGNLFDWCKIEKTDGQRNAFLNGGLEKPVMREVCVKNQLGVASRYIRLELIPADMGQEIAVLTDITSDKEIQSSLMEAMKHAENASKAKNDFLSAMSHDIRTPMNGIMGMTAIAAAHIDDKNRVKDCLKKITEASTHLLRIINEILDMSRIESGKMELSEEPFNMAELIQRVVSMNYQGVNQKRQTIKVHIHSMKHEHVIGDPLQMQRMVANLLSNAIKYTPDGGIIELALYERAPTIVGYGAYELTIKDTGIGMSEEFQKKLFQPFEREEDVKKSKIQGTGLGMAIVKNIITLMMGSIHVESEKNKGTMIQVNVNLRLDKEEQENDLLCMPVLVVDDDMTVCETVVSMLDDIGMIGEWANAGAKAVEMVMNRYQRGEGYIAVLLDWKMPEMDGVETARQIRKQVGPDVPIIILTAYEWSEIEEEARLAGVDAFLTKPIYKTKLRHKLMMYTDGHIHLPKTPEMQVEIGVGKRALLAEDNALNQEIAVGMLQMLGLEIDVVGDGLEAVERFSKSPTGTYDVVLLDIQMPRMNGYEAAQRIRALNHPDSQTIPIVAMTADAFAQDIQSAYASGMNGHISKPISVEQLVQALRGHLMKKDTNA